MFYFWDASDVFIQSIFKLNAEQIQLQVLQKRITTCDNGNIQSHDKEESNMNSTSTANTGAHKLTHD